MKIAITGAMGVGKTTLAKDLAEKLGLEILPEVARIAAEEGYKLDKDVSIDAEMFMISKQQKLEMDSDSWIADRCFIDLLAYISILFPMNILLQFDVSDLLEDAKYDWVLYIPPEFDIEDDGVRSTDKDFQKTVDEKIKEFLPEGYVEVTGSKEDRVNQVLKLIKNEK